MTEELQKLYDELYNETSRDPRKFIKTLESKFELVEKSTNEDKEEYVKVTKIIADYGSALVETGYFSKAVQNLNEAIIRMENEKDIQIPDLYEEPIYETSIFYRGLAHFNLKKYKESTKDFKKLINKFPNNDRYKNWYNGSVDRSFKKLDWTFLSATIVFIVVLYPLRPKDGIMFYISFVGLIVCLITSIALTVFKKRLKVK